MDSIRALACRVPASCLAPCDGTFPLCLCLGLTAPIFSAEVKIDLGDFAAGQMPTDFHRHPCDGSGLLRGGVVGRIAQTGGVGLPRQPRGQTLLWCAEVLLLCVGRRHQHVALPFGRLLPVVPSLTLHDRRKPTTGFRPHLKPGKV